MNIQPDFEELLRLLEKDKADAEELALVAEGGEASNPGEHV